MKKEKKHKDKDPGDMASSSTQAVNTNNTAVKRILREAREVCAPCRVLH